MSRDQVIHDTCEVIITDLVTKNVIGIGYAQTAGLEQTLTEDELRGGIGNKLAYMIRSAKDITLTVTSATFKPEFLALFSGDKIQDMTRTITRMAYFKVSDNAGAKEIKLPTKLAALTEVRVEDTDGTQHVLPATAGVVDASTLKAVEGDELEGYYEEEVTGKGVKFRTNKFPNKFKVEYRTVAYDRELANISENLHFVFPEAIPSGAFNLALQNGEAYIPEFSFRVTAPKGCTTLGETFSTTYDDEEEDC